MFQRNMFGAPAVAAALLAAGMLVGPVAWADPADNCTTVGSATVCDPSMSATPPQPGGGSQNGPYGPSGDTPPVGN